MANDDEEILKIKETCTFELAELFGELKDINSLSNLLESSRDFFISISKAKASKISSLSCCPFSSSEIDNRDCDQNGCSYTWKNWNVWAKYQMVSRIKASLFGSEIELPSCVSSLSCIFNHSIWSFPGQAISSFINSLRPPNPWAGQNRRQIPDYGSPHHRSTHLQRPQRHYTRQGISPVSPFPSQSSLTACKMTASSIYVDAPTQADIDILSGVIYVNSRNRDYF